MSSQLFAFMPQVFGEPNPIADFHISSHYWYELVDEGALSRAPSTLG